VSDTVTSRLSALQYSDTRHGGIARGRQMMVEGLLEGLEMENGISPAHASVITTEIVPLIDSILGELSMERDSDEYWMANTLPNQTRWNSCKQPNIEYNQATTDAAAAFVAFRAVSIDGTHWPSTSTTSDMETNCGDFFTFFNAQTSARDTACNSIPTGVSSSTTSITAWRETMTTYKNGWTTYYGNFDAKYQACLGSYRTYAANKADADSKQTDFETKMCEWNVALRSMCTVASDCANRLDRHHDATEKTYEAKDAVRVENARGLRFVKCILQAIANNVSAADLSGGTTAGSDICPFDTYPASGTCTYADRTTKDICNFSAMPFPTKPTAPSCDATPATLLGNLDGTSGGTWLLASAGPDLSGQGETGAADVRYDSTQRDTTDMNVDCSETPSYWIPYGTKWNYDSPPSPAGAGVGLDAADRTR